MTLRRSSFVLSIGAIALFAAAVPAWSQSGSADLSKIVGLGDSLMSGEVNASVVETFQVNSVPALVHRQVHGSAPFEQALVSEPGWPPRLILGPDFLPIPFPGPPGVPLNAGLERSYDNLGISGGFRAGDLLDVGSFAECQAINDALGQLGAPPRLGCDRVNLVLRDGGNAVSQALSLNPTLVLLWVGGNDVLRAALGGIVIEGITMTPVALFEQQYRAAVGGLVSEGASLAVANIPNVGNVPFVNTIPPVLLDPNTGEPVIINGQPIPLIGPGGVPLSLGDKLTLFALDELSAGCGIPDPFRPGFDPNVCADGYLSDGVVFDIDEQQQVQDRVDALNDVIRTVASENGAALFDFASMFDEITSEGVNFGGIEYTADFITGGLVSFDGFHPNPLVAAMNANGFIGAINDRFGSNIPLVDLFPFVFGGAGNVGPPSLSPTDVTAATLDRIRESFVLGEADAIDVPPRRREGRTFRTRGAAPLDEDDAGLPSRRRGTVRRLR